MKCNGMAPDFYNFLFIIRKALTCPEAVFLVMCDPSMNELWAT